MQVSILVQDDKAEIEEWARWLSNSEKKSGVKKKNKPGAGRPRLSEEERARRDEEKAQLVQRRLEGKQKRLEEKAQLGQKLGGGKTEKPEYEGYYTTGDLARMLGEDITAISRFCRTGRVPSIVFVSDKDVKRYLVAKANVVMVETAFQTPLHTGRRRKAAEKVEEKRICLNCQQEFIMRTSRQIYCNRACFGIKRAQIFAERYEKIKKNKLKTCLFCQAEMLFDKSKYRTMAHFDKVFYCSRECYYAGRKASPLGILGKPRKEHFSVVSGLGPPCIGKDCKNTTYGGGKTGYCGACFRKNRQQILSSRSYRK
jgi:hypothetical protein